MDVIRYFFPYVPVSTLTCFNPSLMEISFRGRCCKQIVLRQLSVHQWKHLKGLYFLENIELFRLFDCASCRSSHCMNFMNTAPQCIFILSMHKCAHFPSHQTLSASCRSDVIMIGHLMRRNLKSNESQDARKSLDFMKTGV